MGMTEAAEKVDELEAELKKLLSAAEPFQKENGADMSEDEASAPLKVFMDVDKELKEMFVATKSFLNVRLRDQKDNATETELVKKLQERVTKAQAEVVTIKKVTEKHEQRALGAILLAESKEMVGTLDGEVKKAAAVCAPLL